MYGAIEHKKGNDRAMTRRKSVRMGLLSGVILGSIVSAWMWYLLNDRETENLNTQQSAKYQAQLSLQKFREASIQKDSMGQLFHLEAAVKFLAKASKESADETVLWHQHQNAKLQLARLRADRSQNVEAKQLRREVLDVVMSTLETRATDESLRELALAAFLDWARTKGNESAEIERIGTELSTRLLKTFELVTPLDQTRLATSELHFLTLESMRERQPAKTQVELIDVALRSLMEGLKAASQPVVYAAQVQKFINEAKLITKASGNQEAQGYFRALNLDWRRRRTQLAPNDKMAQILLAEAIIDTMRAEQKFDEDGVDEVVGLLRSLEKDTLKRKASRRLFFAKSSLAAYLSKQNQIEEAIEYYDGALTIAKQFHKEHPKELVTSLTNLAFLLKRAKKNDRASSLFKEAFETVDQCLPKKLCSSALWLKTYYRGLKTESLKLSVSVKQAQILRARMLERSLSPKTKDKIKKTLSGLKQIGGL